MAQLTLTIEQRVLPAYQSLGKKLSDLYAVAPTTIGFGQFEGGETFYQSRLNYYTSSNKTPDEIHQLGLRQLEDIHQQMATRFAQLGYPADETLAQSYDRVAADVGIIPANEKKATYESLISDAYANLTDTFETFPEQELVVIGGNTGGYYIRGSDDGTRPGAFYADTAHDEPYTTMPTLAYHEGIPGHHMQLALANELDLPLFQRKLGFTSFVEGWALYAERLAKDLGWYANDPYGDLGRLQFEAMRAARLVIDTGIHVMGWSAERANTFHINNVGYEGSITRYSVWPGQATAYSTGMLKILELRDKAEAELGDKYDIKDFHTAVLSNGSMPFTILEQQIQSYLEKEKAE